MSTPSTPAPELEYTKGLYRCQHCPKTYKVYSSFWAHTRTQHKGHKYKCPQCKAGFSYPYQLLKHRVNICNKGGGANTNTNVTPAVATNVPHTGSFSVQNPWLS